MKQTGNLLVISGPSGAGKGTLVARLIESNSHVWVSISATTRKPRPLEEEGVHYFFKTEEEFKQLIEHNGLIEWACVHGSYYGTPRSTVLEHMEAGKQVILEIDVQGAFQVKDKIPEAKLIFIEPPSMEVLEERLRMRGTEDEASIQKRLSNARLELSRKMEYDIVIVNDDLDKASETLNQVVNLFAGLED